MAIDPDNTTTPIVNIQGLRKRFGSHEVLKGINLQVQPGEVTLALPITAQHVHAGGVCCGQTLMAAADTAMVLAVSSQLGGFRPMTTVQLQSSFLRPVPGDSGQAKVVARVLRAGKSLVFGEIEIFDAAGKLATHTTTTYALL